MQLSRCYCDEALAPYCPVHVRCAWGCKALRVPRTRAEVAASIAHHRDHVGEDPTRSSREPLI